MCNKSNLQNYLNGSYDFTPNDDHDSIPYDKLIKFKEWYLSSGRECFISGFKDINGKTIPKKKDGKWLITTGLPINNQDFTKKLKDDNFFRANAYWFIQEVDYIIDIIDRFSNNEEIKDYEIIIKQKLAQIMTFVEKLILDSRYFLKIYDKNYSKNINGCNLWVNEKIEVCHLHETARHLIYGDLAGYSYPDVSISIIRQALEIRIRRAFGIKRKVDQNNNIIPISLNEILKVIDVYKDEIEMDIDFVSLKKINSWANAYLHSGIRPFHWMAPRILDYIGKFTVGGDPDPQNRVTLNSSVRMKKEVHKNVIKTLEENIGDKYKLIKNDIDNCDSIIE